MKAIMQILAAIGFVLGGILLLCAPAPAQSTSQKATAAAATKTFVPTRFTVVDAGTVGKPDVVFVPGLTSSREVWAAEAKRLAPNYRVHLVQVDGFAGQPAGPNATGEILPGIEEELDAYCATLPTKPVVVGHSLGGLLTLLLADRHPADVKKIVIVDSLPWYGMMFGPGVTLDMVKPQGAAMRDMLEKQTPDERKAGSEKTAESLSASAEGRKLVAKNSQDSDPHVMAEAMYEDLVTDVRGDLGGIKTPALMLYPLDTTLVGPMGQAQTAEMVDGMYQGAYKTMPNVKLVRVDHSRHFIQLDQPAEFDELLEGFLK